MFHEHMSNWWWATITYNDLYMYTMSSFISANQTSDSCKQHTTSWGPKHFSCENTPSGMKTFPQRLSWQNRYQQSKSGNRFVLQSWIYIIVYKSDYINIFRPMDTENYFPHSIWDYLNPKDNICTKLSSPFQSIWTQ